MSETSYLLCKQTDDKLSCAVACSLVLECESLALLWGYALERHTIQHIRMYKVVATNFSQCCCM